MVAPRFVDRIERNGRIVEEMPVEVLVERMCSEQTVKTIYECMTAAAIPSRTANTLKGLPIKVGCKTGTAQNRGKDHSAFMGFAPMNDPKIAVAVYVENGGWGATYGVPIGALIMEKYLNGKLSPESEVKATDIQKRRIDYGIHER